MSPGPVLYNRTAPEESLERRLEKGELVVYPQCPFALPEAEDEKFLLQQQLRSLTHKNITYDPHNDVAAGFIQTSEPQLERLRGLLAAYSQAVTAWLGQALPRYQGGCQPDRATYHSEEEATRRLRHTARNDLLHIDAFPNRPSGGRRILRVFTNIHPTESRVWVTAELFPRLLERYGALLGLPRNNRNNLMGQMTRGLRSLFTKGSFRCPYDAFMLRLHDFLKTCDEYQERSPKRLWTFAPCSTWLLYTDACSYAELRGRYALDHSYFIEPRVLTCPDHAPAAVLERASAAPNRNSAA